ncbi:MAG: radical SAM protein [Candidatus Doudnabacteria bacterium]
MKIVFAVSEDENLGVEYISSYLKQNGHTVYLIYDPKQFDRSYLRNSFLARFFDWKRINLEKIQALQPDLIAFSCVTATYQWALSFAQEIKKVLDTPIIFGGVHPTLVPDLVIQNPCVDMVCVGEGEEAFLELVNSLQKKDGRTDIPNIWFKSKGNIIKNMPRPLQEDLDQYPFLDRNLFWNQFPKFLTQNVNSLTSRGCPFNCTYCGNEQKRKVYQGKGRYLRQRSVSSVINELLFLKKNYRIKEIIFVDDVLTMDKAWFANFSKLYRQKVRLPYTCFVHARLLDEKTAFLLKASGCRLAAFGIQSGDEKIRREILHRYESNKEIKRAAYICKKYHLKFMIDHIFDIPFDFDIQKSINLYSEIRPDMINCFNLLYFPKAKIIDYALQAGNLRLEDIPEIERGESIVYETGIFSKKSEEARDYYKNFALFLTSLPLLPIQTAKKISRNPKLLRLFSRLPLFLIPIIKIWLNWRLGHGFLPFQILRGELYWSQQLIKYKLKSLLKNRTYAG